MVIRFYRPTGERGPDISLDLSKTEAMMRLAKSGDPVEVPAGSVPFTTIARIFSRDEIERAALSRLPKVDPVSDEHQEIEWMLNHLTQLLTGLTGGVRDWRVGQGSEMALRAGDRFGVKRGHVGGPEGHAKTPHAPEASKDPLAEDMKWQQRAGDAREIARDH